MSRFFVPRESIKGNAILISGPEAHHMLDVMRLKKGEEVTAFDGEGKEYEGVIKEIKEKSLVVEIKETRDVSGKRKVLITIGQAIPKKEKMDYIIEKATEMGARSIIPIETARSIVKIRPNGGKARLERWQRIALEAAKQSGNPTVPKVERISGFDEAIAKAGDYDLKILACLDREAEDIKSVLRAYKPESVILFVGPEGDFTKEEIGKAKAAGARLVNLGNTVLKSDTAALAMIAMINYEYEH